MSSTPHEEDHPSARYGTTGAVPPPPDLHPSSSGGHPLPPAAPGGSPAEAHGHPGPTAGAPGQGGPGWGGPAQGAPGWGGPPQAGPGWGAPGWAGPEQGGPWDRGPGGPGGWGPPGAPGYPPSAYGTATPLAPADQRTWAVVAHLSGIFVLFLGPLVVWLVFRGRGAYLEHQAKEALNFQLTLLLAYVVGGILVVIGIGLLIVLAAALATVLFGIVAAVAASQGQPYRYPVSLRIIG